MVFDTSFRTTRAVTNKKYTIQIGRGWYESSDIHPMYTYFRQVGDGDIFPDKFWKLGP